MPAWVTGLAFVSANRGATEVIGQAADGAEYGTMTVLLLGRRDPGTQRLSSRLVPGTSPSDFPARRRAHMPHSGRCRGLLVPDGPG
jgi:hypothetical protein